jgi:hypothetical protein
LNVAKVELVTSNYKREREFNAHDGKYLRSHSIEYKTFSSIH